ncbi:MAG: NAD(P)H-dependent flavin oxidoreductase [Pseudomonadota bacterium]
MAFKTALTDLFAIAHPILLAPMGAVSGGALAAAVSRAGGLGLIGPGYLGAEWIAREFDAAEGARVGIGFITWDLANNPGRLDAALTRRPAAVMLSFGDPTPFLAPIKRAGAKLILQVQTLADARAAARLGADVVVAQGTEAGGHGAARALFAFVPAAVDAVAPVPVVAAGGIADGRGLAAALALGAAGVLVGTRFYAAAESLGHPEAKARLVAGQGDGTLRTRVFDIARGLDWPPPITGRALRNDFADAWHDRVAGLEADPAAARERYASAAALGDFSTAVVWAGEGVDLIRDVTPAGEIVERMVAEARSALGAAASAA